MYRSRRELTGLLVRIRAGITVGVLLLSAGGFRGTRGLSHCLFLGNGPV
jgi:hypothetical protein